MVHHEDGNTVSDEYKWKAKEYHIHFKMDWSEKHLIF